MGCGRSKPAAPAPAPNAAPGTAPAPAPGTAGPLVVAPTLTNVAGSTTEKILNLGNGQVFNIYENDFKMNFIHEPKNDTIYILEFEPSITGINSAGNTISIIDATSPANVKVDINNSNKYQSHPVNNPLVWNNNKININFLKTDFTENDICKLEFTFSIYTFVIEKPFIEAEVIEKFTNFKRKFDIDGYSDENPLLGKMYSPYK